MVVSAWVQMIDLDLFFQHLKGHCHGDQFCEKKMAATNCVKKWQTPYFCCSGIQKWNGILHLHPMVYGSGKQWHL